ncbi:hypothetical protein [Roseateles depolymerans]|nr:hypothetical protein [Roseateles depolymerans]
MLFNQETWARFMDGYLVRDCTLGFEEGRLGFLLFEELGADDRMEDGFDIWLLAVKLDQPPESRFFSLPVNRLSVAGQLSSAWSPRDSEFVAVGATREVYAYKPKAYKGREEDGIPFDVRKLSEEAYEQFDCAIYKTVRVGPTVFALGTPFRVFEREGPQQWREHEGIPLPADLGSADEETWEAAIDECAFLDMAGLADNDLYAVGHAGAVWRYSRGVWRELPFPSDLSLHTVAVSPDGTAYITDIHGSVWKGRDDQWQRVVQSQHMQPYQDAAWFNGRLYCANDSAGCFVLENGDMVPAHRAQRDPMPVHTSVHAHRLDVSPNGRQMLVAGMHGASLYDGQAWTLLFSGTPEA